MSLTWIFCLLLAHSIHASEIEKLPNDFILGYATSSYQIEGGWNEDGKGKNFFDIATHSQPNWFKNATGDKAADSYHKYKEDVAMLKNLGAQVYRFSLSWSRILPMGDTSVINQAGIDYYNNLINELLLNDIQPMITMYHWDLPEKFADEGGWTNSSIVEYFEDYSRIIFSSFGDKVKYWITFNEPLSVCSIAYKVLQNSTDFPNHNGDYLCGHFMLIAHAKTYHMYDNEFRASQKGKVGISLSSYWDEPATNSEEDQEAAETKLQFELGWFAHPIFIGDYPPIMRSRVDANSKAEGREISRLPVFDSDTVNLLKGSADFLGLNHYTTNLVSSVPMPSDTPTGWEKDPGVTTSQDQSWPASASFWLKVVPWGFPKLLNWIKNNYGNPTIIITENGFADRGELEDVGRINYHREYMKEMLKAIYEDGCNIVGYTAWSLMDNFEWFEGYTVKFGIYHVDFNSPNRTRTPKASAKFFQELSATRRIPK